MSVRVAFVPAPATLASRCTLPRRVVQEFSAGCVGRRSVEADVCASTASDSLSGVAVALTASCAAVTMRVTTRRQLRRRQSTSSVTGASGSALARGRRNVALQAASVYWGEYGSPTVVAPKLPEVRSKPPRVRFAPSPTGVLHVGGARTALFNWLFAKSQGGEMILRIEDTDMARSTRESEDKILEGLKWCGITWDEGPDIGGSSGPYRQSERIGAGIYQEKLDKMVGDGKVYRCFLTEQELDSMRADAEKREEAFILQSPWSTASEEAIQEQLDGGAKFVYRFRVPFDKEIVVHDLVLGEVVFNTDDLGGDFVIVRKSGIPMYNFGVVVDDASMDITHVLRAQEHLMNTPRQILIYEALGLEVPTFAHMPLILAPDRSKLSKRHGAVSISDYQTQGYLPSGMINYLSQLGWNDGTNKEIYNMDELLASFTMSRMSKVAAIFDRDKFKWVNGNHVRLLSDEKASTIIGEELVRQGVVREASGAFVHQAAVLLRERVSTLAECAEEVRAMLKFPLKEFLAKPSPFIEDGSIKATAKALMEPHVEEHLGILCKSIDNADAIQAMTTDVSKARGGIKKKQLVRPLRICLTAVEAGPDLKLLFAMLSQIDDNVLAENVKLDQRLIQLKEAFPI